MELPEEQLPVANSLKGKQKHAELKDLTDAGFNKRNLRKVVSDDSEQEDEDSSVHEVLPPAKPKKSAGLYVSKAPSNRTGNYDAGEVGESSEEEGPQNKPATRFSHEADVTVTTIYDQEDSCKLQVYLISFSDFFTGDQRLGKFFFWLCDHGVLHKSFILGTNKATKKASGATSSSLHIYMYYCKFLLQTLHFNLTLYSDEGFSGW